MAIITFKKSSTIKNYLSALKIINVNEKEKDLFKNNFYI